MDMSYLNFKNYIASKIPLKEADWEIIKEVSEEQIFEAGTMILEAGKVCRYLYYLNDGLLRYFDWIDGEEKTKFFTFPDQLFTSQQSFPSQVPTQENIQALEKSQVLAIHFDQVEFLFERIKNWSLFIRNVILEVNLDTESLLRAAQNQTAEDRYKTLLNDSPEYLQRIPLKYLASFLGIAPESLSRIRKKVAQNPNV
ncbi:MAG TPA: Crp/Fnr family transcriptional regulator [Microscillaceae bacterium]|nr:Crp/Fnr family transcriptional regulator [Microscillaceae bacterium]